MVEAAKAFNPFAPKPKELDSSNYCPHIVRLGVCLEPEMCFLIHQAPGSQTQMTTAAMAFNPFANGFGAPSQSKEFVPSQEEQIQTPQAGIISMLSRMGLEAQVD